jgi:predicted Zn-dependent protease
MHTNGNTQWGDGIPRWLAILPLVFLALLAAAYIYGIPILARAVAARMPASVTEALSSQTLAALDRDVFQPSATPRERQQAIETSFRALKMPAGSTASYRLEFRKSDAVGANAMALPSGTIVVTDGLVMLAKDDREILGVLAHEAGHVDHLHGMRGMLQSSLMGLLVAWLVGDVSSVAAAAPATLLEANYSRDLEREADTFAIQVLKANGVPLRYLADMLRRLEDASGASGMSSALRYLSTHPATTERIAHLEGQ